MAEPIKIEGLAEFSLALKRMDSDLPKALRLALNDAAQVIIDYARPRVPKRSGRAARSLKARSTRTTARVAGGSARAPYYPWLDFGGRVGRGGSVRRPFLKEGRYIYAGLAAKRHTIMDTLESSLTDTARKAGLEVD